MGIKTDQKLSYKHEKLFYVIASRVIIKETASQSYYMK